VARGWRNLCNEELHELNSSPSIIRIIKPRIRWAWHGAGIEEKENGYRTLVGKPEKRRLLERLRRRWVNNIKISIREMEKITIPEQEHAVWLFIVPSDHKK
jgi:hypothetical protein